MSHTYRCPLRWGDMDAQGHVNNAAYLDYLQDARIDFLTGAGIGDLLDTGVLVVSHQVEYRRPVVVADQDLVIDLWAESVGGSRFVVGYEIYDGERSPETLAARARTAVASYDLATSRLRRLTEVERAALTPHLEQREPLRRVERHEVGAGAHRCPVTVRWSDLDAYNHVNNVKYFDYVQEARMRLLRDTITWRDDDPWSLVRQDIEYLRPTDFRAQPYEVQTSVPAIGNRSMTTEAVIIDPLSAAVHARCRSIVVRATPFDDEQRDVLLRWR